MCFGYALITMVHCSMYDAQRSLVSLMRQDVQGQGSVHESLQTQTVLRYLHKDSQIHRDEGQDRSDSCRRGGMATRDTLSREALQVKYTASDITN